MVYFLYIFYILLGISPSIIWLLFYLRKDYYPEPNKMVIKVFLWGIVSALIAAVLQISIINIFKINEVEIKNFIPFFLYNFFIISLTEELVKYLVIRQKVLKSPELDEPIDVVLYMVIAALGFSAIENILFILNQPILTSLGITFYRFVGATFLHTLSSGIFGYFLVLSFLNIKKKNKYFLIGFFLAVFLHTIFNLCIIGFGSSILENSFTGEIIFKNVYLFCVSLVSLSVLLLGSGFYLSYKIKKIKKIKSICKL
ncbi:MAG TPA: PrsW family glutamic-type intramembrane protease [Candidatus Pacearchaeota archaeon]|nr:PrsW family glutamic-type intramembrane protease [Candidatus Pacearchaeota archaeon]